MCGEQDRRGNSGEEWQVWSELLILVGGMVKYGMVEVKHQLGGMLWFEMRCYGMEWSEFPMVWWKGTPVILSSLLGKY